MRWTRFAAFGSGGLVALATAAYGCLWAPSPSDDCESMRDCAPTEDGGTDADGAEATVEAAIDSGDAASDAADTSSEVDSGADGSLDSGDGSDGFVCDPTKTPAQDACVIADGAGVFVAPAANGGSDSSGTGKMAAPYATIGHAMTAAVASGKRVYACGSAGQYAEALVVDGTLDGVSVYGGLDCSRAAWSYDASKKAIVSPSAPGYALSVSGLKTGATFVDMGLVAVDASAPGGSSVAVFVSNSEGVSFERAAMMAGRGLKGADGATGASNVFPGSLDGNSTTTASGGASKICTCPDQSQSMGGQGGGEADGGPVAPSAGGPIYSGGMAGTNAVACNSAGAAGGDGADALADMADTPSAVFGALSSSGWSPAAGTAGSAGKPGQGGGGGGDGRLSTGGGGGGACGGCGGAGGTPGTGGGSSIALLAMQSTVTLTSCTLTTSAAGAGGTGGNGEQGQAGGSAGAGFGAGVAAGCSGGAGGAGAGGNGAQGGAGGISVGVGYSGTAPTIDGKAVTQASTLTNVTLGAAGAGGAAGSAGPAAGTGLGQPGAVGAPGPNGGAQAVRTLP